jgi:hypothetical protein
MNIERKPILPTDRHPGGGFERWFGKAGGPGAVHFAQRRIASPASSWKRAIPLKTG